MRNRICIKKTAGAVKKNKECISLLYMRAFNQKVYARYSIPCGSLPFIYPMTYICHNNGEMYILEYRVIYVRKIKRFMKEIVDILLYTQFEKKKKYWVTYELFSYVYRDEFAKINGFKKSLMSHFNSQIKWS